jgi:phenylalanine-4-hydroxylase
LQEPDIFHEIFGHTPLLTDRRYADFVAAYGRAGLAAPKEDHVWLARLFWFTVEFGLVARDRKNEIYGAGIVSSKSELAYSVDSEIPDRRLFDIIDVLRTPYRIDILQTVYFVIQGFDELYELANQDLLAAIRRARAMGMKAPTYALAGSAA